MNLLKNNSNKKSLRKGKVEITKPVFKENSIDDLESNSGEENYSESDEEVVPEENEYEGEIEGTEEESDISDDEADEFEKHKISLNKLQETDPEFYKFLRENDKKLLQFDASDSDSEKEEIIHKPPDGLEVDSEESDFEDEETKVSSSKVIKLSMVKEWRENLENDPSLENISKIVKAFQAALNRVKGEEESSEYQVDGSAVFNAVIELCVMHLQPAVAKFLKLPQGNIRHPEKAKKWIKIRTLLQTYLNDLLKLLSGVTSTHIISVLMKHLHSVCPIVACYRTLSRVCLKLLSKLWSTGEETVRVLAYLCILRLVTGPKDTTGQLLNCALKLLYIAYVKSTRFVSVSTLPQINFMRRSLSDLFLINPSLSYQHAFLYIRQLAIHLRNAVTLKKKERFQTVYNWQYIQSLQLWVELLCSEKEELQQLMYPVVTIIIGCIKLIPTAQYVPLRFHCINMLIKLNRETNIYIPTLPFIMETFSIVNLNMKHKKASMKPFDFMCILRVSKATMSESAFTDAVVENLYQLLIEASFNYHNSVTFPDLVVPVIVQLKATLKSTKVSKYISKLKLVLTKIEENSKCISTERNKLSVGLSEVDKIKAFEANINVKGTPLGKFRDQWHKAHVLKTIKKATQADKISEMDIPTIRRDLKRKPDSVGPVELFPSDDEGDEMVTLLCQNDTQKSNAKKIKVEYPQTYPEEQQESSSDEKEDIVEELNISSF